MYINLIQIIIIIIILILGIFSCPCCVCVPGVCVSGGEQTLVKTFTSWQVLASLASAGSGAGGYPGKRITVLQQAWTMPLSWPENNAPIFDNLYRKCYNKCNDDNKNVICHQTGKNAPTRRFAPAPL